MKESGLTKARWMAKALAFELWRIAGSGVEARTKDLANSEGCEARTAERPSLQMMQQD